jgi:hypothetical protein
VTGSFPQKMWRKTQNWGSVSPVVWKKRPPEHALSIGFPRLHRQVLSTLLWTGGRFPGSANWRGETDVNKTRKSIFERRNSFVLTDAGKSLIMV